MAGINYLNPLHPTPSVSFTYDPYFPRITGMRDGTGNTSYSYVPVGRPGALRLAQESGPLPNGKIGYLYDALGRVVSRSVGGAGPDSFAYDRIGRLLEHAGALGKFAFGYLGETGQLASRGLPGDSVVTAWSYLSNGVDRRLAAIDNTRPGERNFKYTTTPDALYQDHRGEVGEAVAKLEL